MRMRAWAWLVTVPHGFDGNCGHGAGDVPVIVWGLHLCKVYPVDHILDECAQYI